MNSISTTKRVLAVLAVTTALCADQAVTVAPAARAQGVEFGQLASRLVTRLARNFRRTLPAAIREPAREQRSPDPESALFAVADFPSAGHAPISPFQFRLPPPAV
jgi:hypothetical protein